MNKKYYFPAIGTTENFIDLILKKKLSTLTCAQALKNYSIADTGSGLDAVYTIIDHVLTNKFSRNTEPLANFEKNCLVIECIFDIIHRPTQSYFENLNNNDFSSVFSDFEKKDGSTRFSKIKSYEKIIETQQFQPPLLFSSYIFEKTKNINQSGLLMIDGARRLVAHALKKKKSIIIYTIIHEEEYKFFIDHATITDIKNDINSLSWFNNYQDIPTLGIPGSRSSQRFELIDTDILKNSTIIDFGCNLGQCCIKSLQIGADKVYGIEGMPDTFNAALRILNAINLKNYQIFNINFNDANFQELIDAAIPKKVDFSFFFSVYRTKELQNRDLLLKYIINKSRNGIYFEGHAHPKIDTIDYYKWVFDCFDLNYEFLGFSENILRPLFFIRKKNTISYNEIKYSKSAKVHICMITYNRIEFTKKSIDSILKHTKKNYILTIIDNNSSDGTQDYLKSLYNKELIDNLVLLPVNVGVAKASNLAWSLEDTPYYLKFDNDIVIQKGCWLDNLISVAQNFHDNGVFAYNFEPISYPRARINNTDVRPKIQGNLGGACILIPKKVHELLGYWSEDYGLYGEEDADYGARVIIAGFENIYMDDENIGVHLPGGKAALINCHSFKSEGGGEHITDTKYRLWKDKQRQNNIKSGALHNNIKTYLSDKSSLLKQSSFLINYYFAQSRKTSIIIPYHNNTKKTIDCINSILECHSFLNFDIILINNNSDEFFDFYSYYKLSNLKVINNSENFSFSAACNQGAAHSNSKYLIFLNNDTVVSDNWINILIQEFESHNDSGAIGCKLLYPDDTVQHCGVTFDQHKRPYHIYKNFPPNHPAVNKKRQFQAVTAACLLTTKDNFRLVNGFDESYCNGFEDVDFCLKLIKSNMHIYYTPLTYIYHYESQTNIHIRDNTNNLKILHKKWKNFIIHDEFHFYNEDDLKVEIKSKNNVDLIDYIFDSHIENFINTNMIKTNLNDYEKINILIQATLINPLARNTISIYERMILIYKKNKMICAVEEILSKLFDMTGKKQYLLELISLQKSSGKFTEAIINLNKLKLTE